ncbi:hypothetical protein LTR36_003009 [Oleoguttula mirabilis]|uniref:Something about silencing protein 4 domain-containing protein n=1 Tax=Oleoguttula mirabilis TaxID=1507867 RepID=A0AAV9JWA8_9PEZI|nr:hypothetical protein LTR36_003009 [Oleoguttula mirabilis]
MSSRPSRAPRSTGGQFANKSKHVTGAKPRPTHTTATAPAPLHKDSTIPNSDSDAFDDDGPPAKKRKLSIRHKQTTLDTHFAVAQSGGPVGDVSVKPPTKITVAQPHGQLLETLNGVRTPLDINEDELSRRASPAAARRSLERVPQPTKAEEKKKVEEKRTLRSQDDGPRLKSELATYFPEYEEIVFGVEQEEDFITLETAIYVTDDAARQQAGSAQLSPQKGRVTLVHRRNGSTNGTAAPATPQRSSTQQQYNGCSPLDLDMFARNIPDHPDDPLDDAHFFKSHRRAERKEKQLRNIERERAMHEKVQLERLLDGLQGHDWLKVLGITGITDGEAKKYEPKRDYFISEVQSLVDKFKQWKEQERKQRLDKDLAAAAAREAESEERETEEGSEEPPSSELNASASRQLLQETNNAVRSGFKIRLSKKGAGHNTPTSTPNTTPAPQHNHHTLHRPPQPPSQPPTYHPRSPDVPMTSFFAKRHLRDAALGKARHGRSSMLAFGQPIPEMALREFALPAEYVTEETLRANARERRRRKRAGVAEAAEAAEGGGGGAGGG